MIFLGAVFVVVVLLGIAAAVAPSAWLHFLNAFALFGVATVGAVPYIRATGFPPFSQAAFFGLGALGSAWLTVEHEWLPIFALFVVVIVGAILAFAMSRVLSRLSRRHGAIFTLSLAVLTALIPIVARLYGPLLIKNVPYMIVFGFEIKEETAFLIMIWFALLLLIWIVSNIFDSRIGRALVAADIHPAVATGYGVDPRPIVAQFFILASMPAVCAGWFFAHWQHEVGAGVFSLGATFAFSLIIVSAAGFGPWGIIFSSIAVTAIGYLSVPLWVTHGLPLELIALLFCAVILGTLSRFYPVIWGFFRKFRRRLDPHVVDLAGVDERSGMKGQGAPPPGFEIVALQKVTVGPADKPILNAVDFAVSTAEIVAVMSPSRRALGAMMAVLSGDAKPTSGEMTIWGNSSSEIESTQWSKYGIARSYQPPKLIDEFPVVDNVVLGAHARERTSLLLAMLRINGNEDRMLRSEAMHHLARAWMREDASMPVNELSEGKQRLVEIARAMSSDPALILLAEPSRGMTDVERNVLIELLRDLREVGIGIVLFDSHLDMIRLLADRMVVLDDGKVVATGVAERVLAEPSIRKLLTP